MEDFIWLRFFLRSLDEFYDTEHWQQFFTFLREKGYTLSSTATGSEDLLSEIQAFVQQRDGIFSIDVSGALEFRIDIVPEEGYMLLDAEAENQFSIEEEGFTAYQAWLELLKEVYTFWHPLMVYQFNENRHNVTRDNIVSNQHLNWLYDIAIYSPQLVDAIGCERLLSAPAWRIDELDDGAIMVVPEEHYYLPREHHYRDVAQHLGFVVPPLSNE
ncbi:hypothetical protein [Dictyobacter aurantiacus]|uniref:Immunity protein 52 domain-containing protein n=1 Tax=Dictyobacter aurantiacus TaxID=1936993 RepID=A0A401ZF25_9CHLR|nr:hypothetical protein [Dictyobacter aurantiacus]GCE05491.1 hypothetical protein KDAU_28200 [Dictyobacter aurantiacus]